MSIYHVIIAACAILTVMAIYKVRLPQGFFRSAILGGAFVLAIFIVLAIIGST
jgi:hypothetical protein